MAVPETPVLSTGLVRVGAVRVLLVRVSVLEIVGITTALNVKRSEALAVRGRSPSPAVFLKDTVSVFPSLTCPAAAGEAFLEE